MCCWNKIASENPCSCALSIVQRMDTEELIKKCKAISLNEETRGKVTLKGKMKEMGEKIRAGCLVGKVLLNRAIKKE